MLLDKHGELIKNLDFRGTKIELLNTITAPDLFRLLAAAQQLVNRQTSFKARDLIPSANSTSKTATCIYRQIFTTTQNKNDADRLFGVVIKQALIMTPLLFRQIGADNDFEGSTYVRESLDF